MEKAYIIIRAADPDMRGFAVLSDEEKKRAEAKHVAARPSYVTARSLLRWELATTLGMAPADVPLRQEGNGPVILQGGLAKDIYFSVAHTGTAENGIVAVAVSRTSPIGIDIELPDRDLNWLRMAERRFAVGDHEELLALDADAGRRRFYEMWTLRESLVKMEHGRLMHYLKYTKFDFTTPEPQLVGKTPGGLEKPTLFNRYFNEAELMVGCAAREKLFVCVDMYLGDSYTYLGPQDALGVAI